MPYAGDRSNKRACAAFAVVMLVGGCGRTPSRIQPANINPENAGREAVAAYDQDGDGLLSKEELKKCPALLAAIDSYETGGDGTVNAGEITARLKAWRATRVGITAAALYLKLDGRPLVGARVLLVPEPFLEGAVKPASAETDSTGLAGLSMAAEDLPEGVRFGLQNGLYKIKVSHPDVKIPAKYNEQTELGLEVPPHFDLYNPPLIKLTTK